MADEIKKGPSEGEVVEIDEAEKPLDKEAIDHIQLLTKLEIQKATVLTGVKRLIESGTIEDETDRNLVQEAATFIENPSENYEEIKQHRTRVGDVLVGYEMQGAELPPEIDALHAYLTSLQCINLITSVEQKLREGAPANSPEIKNAMTWALDCALGLSKGYKDDTLLKVVQELQSRLGN